MKFKIYIIIILSIVLYGCETLSLTLREGPKLSVFENRVLRIIFVPKSNEVCKQGPVCSTVNTSIPTVLSVTVHKPFISPCM